MSPGILTPPGRDLTLPLVLTPREVIQFTFELQSHSLEWQFRPLPVYHPPPACISSQVGLSNIPKLMHFKSHMVDSGQILEKVIMSVLFKLHKELVLQGKKMLQHELKSFGCQLYCTNKRTHHECILIIMYLFLLVTFSSVINLIYCIHELIIVLWPYYSFYCSFVLLYSWRLVFHNNKCVSYLLESCGHLPWFGLGNLTTIAAPRPPLKPAA